MFSKIFINGIKLTPLRKEEVLSEIIQLLGSKNRSCQLTYLNAYVYYLASRDKELNASISDSEIVLADGISIIYATLLIKRILIKRCIMTRVFDDFLVSSKVPACNCILIGVTDQEIKAAMDNINRDSKNVNIVEAYSGFHDNQYYSEILNNHFDIDIVLIGMSTPKSEYLCRLARQLCKNSIIWHIGGGTIKCYAGTKKRAPEWISKMGIEWMHRFLFEKHTRKRYLIYNFLFIYFVLIGFFKSINRK